MDAVLQQAKRDEQVRLKKQKRPQDETKEEFEAKYMDVNKQYEPLISKEDDDEDSDADFVHQQIGSEEGNEEINFELTKFDAEELRVQEDYRKYEESYK